MAVELEDIYAALGIAEDADPVAAIAAMKVEASSLRGVIASDKGKTELAEVVAMRNELADIKGKLIIEQTENASRIEKIEAAARRDRVIATVERAIAKGKPPRVREDAIEYGMMVTAEKLDSFLATIPSVDMTERGVASGSELDALTPTDAEMGIRKAMYPNETPAAAIKALMNVKAKAAGLTLPEA